MRKSGLPPPSAILPNKAQGVTATVAINDLRLTGLAYDDKTLRVIASADGAASVAVSSLNGL